MSHFFILKKIFDSHCRIFQGLLPGNHHIICSQNVFTLSSREGISHTPCAGIFNFLLIYSSTLYMVYRGQGLIWPQMMIDEPVKSQISALLVIPVKTGIQYFHIYTLHGFPLELALECACRGRE